MSLELSPLQVARERIRAVYDPELLRQSGHQLIDLLAEHLSKAENSEVDVLPWRVPESNIKEADLVLDAACCPGNEKRALADRFSEIIQTMLDHGLNLHHPHYIGHQVPAPSPIAGLFDSVGAVTNQVMAVYEMGPWATATEVALINRFGGIIGWEKGTFSGLITHGGSLANLTALLTARNVRLGGSWEEGIPCRSEDERPVVVVHSDVHYSVSRAVGVLGIGARQVSRAVLDARRRIDPQHLDEQLADFRRRGQPVVAVVACACATPIGAFDPLIEIGEICRRHDVWLHVDAAHGGAALFSRRHRDLLRGLELADSITWDAHKMMFVPALCAFVLYRDKSHRFETFRQEAPYLFDPSAPGLVDYDVGLKTIECTKRATAFGLWGLWALFGPQLFEDLVDVTFDLGQILYEKLESAPDFHPLHEPQCNILAFRYLPKRLAEASLEAVGQFQFELRRRLVESGSFYITSNRIDGFGALRVSIMNPLTTADNLDRLLESIRAVAEGINSPNRDK